jgi:signal transduction histidine kinase
MLGAVRRCSGTGQPFMVEHRIVRGDGSLRWLEGRGEAFMVDGRPARMVGTCHDVTDRKLLEESLRATLADVRSSRTRIVEAADAERRRVERDLHDGAQQRLLAAAMALRTARGRVDAEAQPGLAAALECVQSELREALGELRDLARGIHPGVLAEQGLRVAIESVAVRSPLPVVVRECPDERLPEPVEIAAYYIVCEALTNAVRHAGARRATVNALRRGDRLAVEIADDGRGGARIEAGGGLSGLADRVATLDGRLTLRSGPGAGTVLSAELPCA